MEMDVDGHRHAVHEAVEESSEVCRRLLLPTQPHSQLNPLYRSSTKQARHWAWLRKACAYDGLDRIEEEADVRAVLGAARLHAHLRRSLEQETIQHLRTAEPAATSTLGTEVPILP